MPKNPHLAMILGIIFELLEDSKIDMTLEHIPQQFNKRSDVIANAAVITKEEGERVARSTGEVGRSDAIVASMEEIMELDDPFPLTFPSANYNIWALFSEWAGRGKEGDHVLTEKWEIYPRTRKQPLTINTGKLSLNIKGFAEPVETFGVNQKLLGPPDAPKLMSRVYLVCKRRRPVYFFTGNGRKCDDCIGKKAIYASGHEDLYKKQVEREQEMEID